MSIKSMFKSKHTNTPVIVTDSEAVCMVALLFCIKFTEKISRIYNLDLNQLRQFGIKDSEPVIIISNLITEGNFTQLEIDALIAHEEGHIVNKDLDEEKKPDSNLNSYSQEKEYKADKYAVDLYTSDVFKPALLKVAALTVKHVLVYQVLSAVDNSFLLSTSERLADRIISFDI